MSEAVPGQCRSQDCTERAEFYAEMVHGNRSIDNWNGEFCLQHLVRCLELKVPELSDMNHTLLVERMIWIDNPLRFKRHRNMVVAISRAKRGGAW